MRFKAKLATEHVQLLNSLIGPMSRLAAGDSTLSGKRGGGSKSGGVGNPQVPMSGLTGGGTIVHLDPQHVRLSAKGGCGNGMAGGSGGADGEGIATFAELTTTGGIFLEHRIESASDNVIVFEIDLAQLRTALQSVLSGGIEGSQSQKQYQQQQQQQQQRSQALHNSTIEENGRTQDTSIIHHNIATPLTSSITVMKLAKRNGGLPCLCLDASCAGGSVEVHHAIPVRIMRAADMQYHLPPRINMPDVQLEIPPERPLRTVVERLRCICPHIYMEGSMSGELTLRHAGDGASIRTFFGKLIPRFEDCKVSEEDAANLEDSSRCILKVDTRKLSACLQWQATMQRNVGSALLCMVENEMLVLHVCLNPESVGFFTYYIPVLYMSPEDMEDIID